MYVQTDLKEEIRIRKTFKSPDRWQLGTHINSDSTAGSVTVSGVVVGHVRPRDEFAVEHSWINKLLVIFLLIPFTIW